MFRPRFLLLVVLCGLTLSHPAAADENGNNSIRFATFNIAMGLKSHGELYQRLQSGADDALRKVAAIIQQVRPDVLLLNEFDYLPGKDAGALFVSNYLAIPQFGRQPIGYAYALDGPVNTGVDSGLDLNHNGARGEAEDAWGYGRFRGQYGMLVLSRFPLKAERTFQLFKWHDMPAAVEPLNPDGTHWYPDEIRQQLRLSSKSHWDLELAAGGRSIHFLVSHPTPPVFDGPEDRNGARNHDEIRLWADYVDADRSAYIYDDAGFTGGLPEGAQFVIAGDLNADPVDGDSRSNASQLLEHPSVDASCQPISAGAIEAGKKQGGKNLEQRGNPAADTADFDDQYTGNLQVDYVLPSAALKIVACGVFWPASNQPGHELIDVSDHRLVWLDVEL